MTIWLLWFPGTFLHVEIVGLDSMSLSGPTLLVHLRASHDLLPDCTIDLETLMCFHVGRVEFAHSLQPLFL